MDPLVTLYEREPSPPATLPAELSSLYNGGLLIPDGTNNLPYVFANFVETLDGIVSYNAPGQTGGGVISGGNLQDKMVMGLLRARADAVIFGSSSLLQDANHPRIPSFIFPSLADAYAQWRIQLKKEERYPISVIVTASGHVNLQDRTFYTPDLRSLIATTEKGYNALSDQPLSVGTEVRVVPSSDGGESVSPSGVLELLAREFNVSAALYEGGPTLLASFLRERRINELFLTLAPQLAGQSQAKTRLSLVEGYAFPPQDAPWGELLSVKLAGSHLLLRYKLP